MWLKKRAIDMYLEGMSISGISRILSKVFSLGWVVLIFLDIWFSLKPHIELPLKFSNSDKFLHMDMYLVLALLPFLFLKRSNIAIYFAIFSLWLGIVLEFCQFYVPFREFSIMDICANEVGILLGIVLGDKLTHILKER
jgi:VanZ family protein